MPGDLNTTRSVSPRRMEIRLKPPVCKQTVARNLVIDVQTFVWITVVSTKIL